MGSDTASSASGGAAGGPGQMTNVVANLTLKIVEEQGSETRNARPKTEYAALPSVNVATPPPGARSTGAEAIRRYIVVEDEGVFYLPESPQLQGKRGVAIDTSADQLIKLGFTPDAAIKF